MSEAKSAKSDAQENKKQGGASKQKKFDPPLPTEWAQAVLNQLVAAQKAWFEIASQQNALLLETVKNVSEMRKNAPTDALSDWAKQGIEGFVEAQKRWSEIAVQQSEKILRSVQTNADFSADKQTASPENAAQNIESLVKMRAAWLDFIAEQNSQIIKAMKDSLKLDQSSPVAALADFAQEAVNNYIEVQKRWLDLALQLPFPGNPKDDVKK